MLEHTHGETAVIEHQILADIAARIGEPLREGGGFRHKQKSWSLGAVGANHHRFRSLEDFLAPAVKVDSSAHSAIFSYFDLPYIRVGTNLAASGFDGRWNERGERARL